MLDAKEIERRFYSLRQCIAESEDEAFIDDSERDKLFSFIDMLAVTFYQFSKAALPQVTRDKLASEKQNHYLIEGAK
jgi:hypothetical protein